MRTSRLLTATLVMSVAFVGVALQAGAQEPEPVLAADGVVVSPDTVEMAARKWTQAEMAAAIPLDVLVPGTNRGPATEPVVGPDGPAGYVKSYTPTRTALIPVVPDVADEVDAIEPAVFPTNNLAYTYPPPFTRLEVFTGLSGSSSYKVFPYRLVGKLYFKQYGVSYVCSASLVSARHIFTAGHCVHKGNNLSTGWSTSVVFVPAFRDGAKPYGQYLGSTMITATEWYKKGNPNGLYRDVGGVKLTTSTALGYLGFAYNQDPKQHVNDFGYPAASPFNGNRMITCQASANRRDTAVYGTPDPWAIGCDMTGGSSGGPWLVKLAGVGGTTNLVNGVNSYKYNNDTKQMYSPYFDSFVYSLYNQLKGL